MPTPRKPDSPPNDLDAESKRLWRSTIAYLTEQGTWQESDAGVLERYVRAVQLERDCRGWLQETGIVTSGSMGQPTKHPLEQVRRDALSDAHKFAEALLLTPSTRLRHELENRKSSGGDFAGLLG